jgi:hypothetical protein
MQNVIASTLAMLFLASAANGQRLYRKELDAAAQQALKAMEKVDSKQLFDRMLQNLSTQSKQDFETTFSGIRRQTRDRIQSWDTWCAVHRDMDRAMTRLGYPGLLRALPDTLPTEPDLRTQTQKDEHLRAKLRTDCGRLLEKDPTPSSPEPVVKKWKELLEQIENAKADRQNEINDLIAQPGTAEPRLLALLGQLGNLTEVEQALKQFQSSPLNGKVPSLAVPASETVAILTRLGQSYQEFKDRRDQIGNVRQELRELRAEMLKVAVLKLVAEQEHLKRMISIEERRAREIEDAVASFDRYRNAITCERQREPGFDLKRIDDSLRALVN